MKLSKFNSMILKLQTVLKRRINKGKKSHFHLVFILKKIAFEKYNSIAKIEKHLLVWSLGKQLWTLSGHKTSLSC